MWPSPKHVESLGLYECGRKSQTRQREGHCWELQDEPFAFFADELVLHAWIYSEKVEK